MDFPGPELSRGVTLSSSQVSFTLTQTTITLNTWKWQGLFQMSCASLFSLWCGGVVENSGFGANGLFQLWVESVSVFLFVCFLNKYYSFIFKYQALVFIVLLCPGLTSQ